MRILRYRLNFLLWPTALGRQPAIVPPGRYMGAMVSIHSGHPDRYLGHADLNDNRFSVVQAATNGDVRVIDSAVEDFSGVENGVLAEDHTLYVKHAVWLNDTGLYAHMETTLSNLWYQFEPIGR